MSRTTKYRYRKSSTLLREKCYFNRRNRILLDLRMSPQDHSGTPNESMSDLRTREKHQ